MNKDLSWLCMVIPFGVIVLSAILGTRSRLRLARRIREARAQGEFANMSTPKNKPRFRLLALLALVGAVGMTLSLIFLVLDWMRKGFPSFGILGVLVMLFGIISAIAGYLMQREITRRL